MRVLFVYPDISVHHVRSISLGIGHISSVLKENGHHTDLYYFGKINDIFGLFEKIKSFRPDLIAFSSVTSQFEYVRKISKEVKHVFDIPIICGGIHPTLAPDCLMESEGLDAVCRGEGEYAMLELVEKMDNGDDYFDTRNFWFKKGDRILRNDMRPLIKDLDNLPFPDREIFDYQKIIDNDAGYARFVFNRGCPFNCSYCCNHALRELYRGKGKYVRFKSVEKALEEISLVTEKYKVKRIIFDDDTFSLNKKWFFKFCSEYRKKFDLPFHCNIRVGTCDRKMFQVLKDAGCYRVAIGIESGNPYIRKTVLKRDMSNMEIERAFKIAHNVGLETFAYNMIGIPYEDPEKFEDTIKLNRKISPTFTNLSIFYPYPRTSLGELCIKNNWIRKDAPADFIEREDTILNLPTFRREDILNYYKTFHFRVRVSNWSFKNRILCKMKYSKFGDAVCRILGEKTTEKIRKLMGWLS